MKKLLQFMLNFQLKNSQFGKGKGFTLIELLVALVIASIIISSLLGFMVNILTTERREQAKTESEREIQAAINYIARDLRQAVHIYDAEALSNNHNSTPTPGSPSGIKDQIPPVSPTPGCTVADECQPVLVFWKREFVEDAVPIVSTATCPTAATQCDDTFVYSLVGYFLVRDSDSDWSGTARIARFQIDGGVTNPFDTPTSTTDDYVTDYEPDPGFKLFDQDVSEGTRRERMNQWTKDTLAYTQPARVLVDYIDHSTVGIPAPNATTAADCPAILANDGYDLDGVAGTIEYSVQQTPDYSSPYPAGLATGSFYACVDSIGTEAKVFIRGNALARINSNNVNDAIYNSERLEFFPATNLRVQGRGLVE